MRMCQGSRGRRDINEHGKSSEPDKQYELFFFSFLYICIFLTYFILKKAQLYQQKNKKQNKYKKKYTEIWRASRFQ